ncbi:preprotein translocase subunit YajC [Paramicrobacterium chengjingii]|uniref:Preprotein translocase subunit YajC n=1 Tax=Paramicrobacterium chengjingii TaxID=2769067 RepID=A0ABX6YMD5_9MICO|nr:preprotein translocase subunit YajC [Microbacterium chengjingii]QPZ40013.1 preprotein translocase subunit YajC [Microbacterium chengjingii]
MDPLTIAMLAILAVLIFFMFRNSQKRKRDQQELQSKVAPGAEVMTNFGLFGTILSIDEDDNKVELQTGADVVLTVHRQTITRVIDNTDDAESEDVPMDDAEDEIETDDTDNTAPNGDNKSDNA